MKRLRLLHLEDNALDGELVLANLEAEEVDCEIDRVWTETAFQNALLTHDYDLILSDFSMPGFDGLKALETAKTVRPNIPFLFLSGTIGEERAVESLKRGAVDYILKDRLQRLSSAVLRAYQQSLDLQKRLEYENQLRQQAQLLNQANDAIFARNLDQEITYWNKAAERIYGWTAEEALGKRASDLLYKEGAPVRHEIWKTVLEKGEWSGDVTQVTKAGKDITVSSHRTLLRNSAGAPISVLNINTDITERKALEAQLFRSQRMESIGALASGIAHDLNNVLSPIMMAAELLRERLQDPDDIRMIDIAKSSAHRGADLVKQILQFTRGTKAAESSVNLRVLIDDLLKVIRKTFSPAIRVQAKVSSDLCPLLGDATQIHQILLNLCVNARDAMPDGGTLTIEAKNSELKDRTFRDHAEPVSGSFVELAVTDTGTGIPPHVLERIMEPFFTTKAEGKGTGLGLSTVSTVIRNHHGFLEIETAVGVGTTFRAFLPATAPNAAKNVEKDQDQAYSGHGELILLVDDELALLEMTKELLEAHNYQILTASNGAEALESFDKNQSKIAAVITDLLMPYMNGNDLITNICERFPETITICLSGSAEGPELRPSQIRASAYLKKPCPTNELLTALDNLLKSRRPQPS